METINRVIEDILIELGFENLYYAGILKRNWDNVVGNLISKVSLPEKIEKETLFIKCSNPAWKQELYFFKDEIINNINEFFKKNVIANVKIYSG